MKKNSKILISLVTITLTFGIYQSVWGMDSKSSSQCASATPANYTASINSEKEFKEAVNHIIVNKPKNVSLTFNFGNGETYKCSLLNRHPTSEKINYFHHQAGAYMDTAKTKGLITKLGDTVSIEDKKECLISILDGGIFNAGNETLKEKLNKFPEPDKKALFNLGTLLRLSETFRSPFVQPMVKNALENKITNNADLQNYFKSHETGFLGANEGGAERLRVHTKKVDETANNTASKLIDIRSQHLQTGEPVTMTRSEWESIKQDVDNNIQSSRMGTKAYSSIVADLFNPQQNQLSSIGRIAFGDLVHSPPFPSASAPVDVKNKHVLKKDWDSSISTKKRQKIDAKKKEKDTREATDEEDKSGASEAFAEDGYSEEGRSQEDGEWSYASKDFSDDENGEQDGDSGEAS